MIEDSESETGTILTSTGTAATSSTIPGPGALSGKAIKLFGTLVMQGLDAIIYRRRLAQIEHILQKDPDAMTNLNLKARKLLYSDLIELSVYSVSIRTRAFRLIMRKIGRKDLQDLATVIVHLSSSETRYDILRDMFFCVQMYKRTRRIRCGLDALDRNYELAALMSYYLPGLQAYSDDTRRMFAPQVDIPRVELTYHPVVVLNLSNILIC
ncbi:hypothetical protein BDP27DRAFT_1449021 [Rhodocollybia butyracea]|uniref:Uncharacterized protein n=1 Tax=Rhodocollybia butyracea TaxID=206335 RepID=A0A9P5PT55_9AGAR|nr:hypothetical protein BDP27DRAFT_1449021 [Rhodocollybia butyracea]